MIFEIIVGTYCIVGLILNLVVLPHRNKDITKQNDYIMLRYAHMERLMKAWEKSHDE